MSQPANTLCMYTCAELASWLVPLSYHWSWSQYLVKLLNSHRSIADSNQQSVSHAKSINILFLIIQYSNKSQTAPRLSDFHISRQPINETRLLWIMNNPENEYGLSLRQIVWIWHYAFEAVLRSVLQGRRSLQIRISFAYFKGQCPGEANTGYGCQYCYGGHSQSRVCDHKAEPMHLCTGRQRNSTLSNDCPGEHHVISLWGEMLEPWWPDW